MNAYPLVVIGGGTAAIAAITEALELGITSIACIEQRSLMGGECANNGCVPLHVMLAGANLFHQYQNAWELGINIPPLQLDFGELMAQVESVVENSREALYKNEPRVTRYQGIARFKSPHQIQINSEQGGVQLEGEQIVIAIGAHPVIPDITGLSENGYWLYPQATHTKTLPDSLAVIGGGRIGVEFAQLFQRLGCRVTLLEAQDRLLYREDPCSSEIVLQALEQEGVQVYLNAEVVQAESASKRKKAIKRLSFLGPNHELETVDAEEILVATGRQGNTAGLHLDQAGVESDANGILINDRCQTTQEHIWAVGDVVGPYRFTNVADYQAVVAVQNLSGYRNRRLCYNTVPWAYYTDPPLARVGQTEPQARANFQSVVVLQQEIQASTRHRLDRQTFGFCKILVDTDTEQILGAHIMSPRADDLIHIPALAMQAGIPVPELTELVYTYPSHAQLIQKTLEAYRQRKVKRKKPAKSIRRR